jgi:site-specific recombinase XerD
MLRSIRRASDARRHNEVLLDRLGRMRSTVNRPGCKAGQRPANHGRRFPAEVLTTEEISRLLAACARRGPSGLRHRALIVVLWRGGLRCQEALDLEPRDVDAVEGTVLVRHGKGNRRRVVGLDPQAFAVLERWMDARAKLGVPRGSKLFCTITAGNVGAPMGAPQWRDTIKQLGIKAGIEKRVHSHGLRHTHATELRREGVDVLIISRQLGHADLATTQRYLEHLEPREVVEAMQHRSWPLAA